jgi:hypothetical protein
MGRINMGRVLLGGLVAGLIINIGEYLLNEPILGEQWRAAMVSLNRSAISGQGIGVFIAMSFVLGITAVWLYAAIRPRFGPGPKTAICAGLLVWFLAYLFPTIGNYVLQLFPGKILATATIWGLFEVPLATLAGAWLYREP